MKQREGVVKKTNPDPGLESLFVPMWFSIDLGDASVVIIGSEINSSPLSRVISAGNLILGMTDPIGSGILTVSSSQGLSFCATEIAFILSFGMIGDKQGRRGKGWSNDTITIDRIP